MSTTLSSKPVGGSGGYVERKIDIGIHIGEGDYGEKGGVDVKLRGLRVNATITKTGMPGYNTADVRIYGMDFHLMNKVTSLGRLALYKRENLVTISAGDSIAGIGQVFAGVIQEAWTNFDAMPDVYMNMSAQTGIMAQMKPVPPTAYGATADIVVVMTDFASRMGLKFENNGVEGIILSYPYWPGTLTAQVEAAARAAHIGWSVDDTTLAIWPMDGARGGTIPLISPATGMVGYPSYTGQGGIHVRTAYNPSITFNGKIQVKSSVTPANNIWIVNSLVHTLDSETPNGSWFTDIEGWRIGDAPKVPHG